MATLSPSVFSPHAGDHRVQLIYWCHLSYPLFHSHPSHHEVLIWTKQEHLTPWVHVSIFVHLLSIPHVATRVISFKSHLMKLDENSSVPVIKIQGVMTWSLPASLAWPLSATSLPLWAPHILQASSRHKEGPQASPSAEEVLSLHYVSPSLPLLIIRAQLWCHFLQAFLGRPTLGTLIVLPTFYLLSLSEFSF